MINEFVKISALPPADLPLTGNEQIPMNQVGNTSKATSGDFVLPVDSIILYSDIGRLTQYGARVLTSGPGISISVAADHVIISASSSGGIIVFDLKILVNVPAGPTDDWNPTGWNEGAGISSLRMIPANGGSTLNGIDSSGMVDGQTVQMMNQSTVDSILLINESGTSALRNRFFLPLNADFNILPGQVVELIYDADTNRLRIH